MPLLKNWQRAYLAGILDGEGCIRIRNNGSGGCVSVHVTNTNKDLLNWCLDVTGMGYIYCIRKKRYGTHKKQRKAYAWELSPKQAIRILKKIKKYLIVKKKEADLALGYQKLIKQAKCRPTIMNLQRRNSIRLLLHEEKLRGEYLALN